MNELLYDVAILKYATVYSGKSNKELAYVTDALWLVESELSLNKREALYDFNKLVIGRSKNLLFVGPLVNGAEEQKSYLEVLGAAAKHCSCSVYLALIPHPGDWGNKDSVCVSAWEWKEDCWSAL